MKWDLIPGQVLFLINQEQRQGCNISGYRFFNFKILKFAKNINTDDQGNENFDILKIINLNNRYFHI